MAANTGLKLLNQGFPAAAPQAVDINSVSDQALHDLLDAGAYIGSNFAVYHTDPVVAKSQISLLSHIC